VVLLGAQTPSKNPPPISGCKHTSLAFLIVTFYELRHDGVLRSREESSVGPAFASYASTRISEHVSVHNTLRNGTLLTRIV
jgi:hypothetical protein